MKALIVLGTLFLILATFIYVANNAAHVAQGHDDQIDINNAESEIERYKGYMDAYAIERGRLVAAAYAGQALLSTAQSGMGTIAISALSGIASKSIANALGLGAKAFLIEHGSTELGSFIDTVISDANTYTAAIDYLYNNTTKLPGVAFANSAFEGYMDACDAVDHYNDHNSAQRNPPNVPIKPPDPQLPVFGCPGVCGNTYITVAEALSDHYAKCGTGVDVDTFTVPSTELESRSVKQGCGREWYTCEPEDDEKAALHDERTCKKWRFIYDSALDRVLKFKCSEPYRRCLGKYFDHNPRVIGSTKHSDEANNNSGDEQAENPSPSPSPAMHACGVHESWQSGDHSAGGCGTSGHFACDGSDHSAQASCPSTDTNGNTCTVTGFYACQSHTHQFPAPAPVDPDLCPAADCNVRLNDTNRSEHVLVTCTGGSRKSCRQEYYKCQADDHKWLYCQRGSSCPYFIHNQSRYRIRRCMESNNVGGCITVNGKRQPHDVQ